MTELLHAAVSPPNLLPTTLLVFVLLYWLTVIIGLLDFKTLDLHTHHDFDLPHATHVAPDSSGMGVSWLNNALAFFNLGRVPLMVFLSFVALPLWVGSILLNYYLGNTSLLVGLLLLLPLFIGSLLLAKVLTLPFVHLFAALERNHDSGAQPLGKVCTVLLPTTHDRLGQASVRLLNGAPLVLNVRAASATTELRKGESALVIDYDTTRRCYLIEPYETT
ncbi:hypothetical protein J0X19_15505 [Hymenobacter sp. BT186]|uniref:DUF1449 family protein n=1 Tax=Hymenobacter telluris TaxID=2816474 RepID=A0A939EWY0_9BACT|nr:hypothetical protein [Hymenobacter telluris]MBO0359369.1 hypothetical protein [Hymenobacter telluris]MBW3375395.1 hypothetical protein [Hymenobacter norwichensis]